MDQEKHTGQNDRRIHEHKLWQLWRPRDNEGRRGKAKDPTQVRAISSPSGGKTDKDKKPQELHFENTRPEMVSVVGRGVIRFWFTLWGQGTGCLWKIPWQLINRPFDCEDYLRQMDRATVTGRTSLLKWLLSPLICLLLKLECLLNDLKLKWIKRNSSAFFNPT